MTNFTKLFCAAALCMGAMSAYAQDDEVFDFDETFYHQWSGAEAGATDNGQAGNAIVNLNTELDGGKVVWGNQYGSVPYLCYADLTDYSQILVEGTPGGVLRFMTNRVVDEGPIYELPADKATIGEDGKLTVSVSDLKFLNGGTACDFVHLQGIKVAWSSPALTITSLKVVRPGDPLSLYKESLKKAINRAKMVTPVGKTEESFASLTNAILAAEQTLAMEGITAEMLDAVTEVVYNAINNVELADGYTNMTADLFKTWESHQATEGTVNSSCAYELFVGSGLPYGLSTVDMNNFADLSAYDCLIVTVADGAPRFCFNRLTANGQDNDDESLSEMIDIPNNSRSTEAYQTKDEDGKVFTINLKKMTADKGFAHLHCIKGANWANVTVTDLLLMTDVETAIRDMQPAATAASQHVYDLQGRRVAQPTRGMYIVNGKKVVLR